MLKNNSGNVAKEKILGMSVGINIESVIIDSRAMINRLFDNNLYKTNKLLMESEYGVRNEDQSYINLFISKWGFMHLHKNIRQIINNLADNNIRIVLFTTLTNTDDTRIKQLIKENLGKLVKYNNLKIDDILFCDNKISLKETLKDVSIIVDCNKFNIGICSETCKVICLNAEELQNSILHQSVIRISNLNNLPELIEVLREESHEKKENYIRS